MTNTKTSIVTLTLCRLSVPEAEHLALAPAAIGGWCAVHPDCRDTVTAVVGLGKANVLALLPSDWTEATRRPVPADLAEQIAARLARTTYSLTGEPEVAHDFAARIRAHLDSAAEVA